MDTDVEASFGALLRDQRRRAELTQEALAERAGISVRSIQALESGASHPQPDTARRLVGALSLHGEERVRFEAVARGAVRRPLSAARGAARAEPAHNLPLELTSFVGREAEVVAVRAMLDQTRLLTLVGTGGVGKTRLALHVAAQERPAFADGVWLVELAALSDPALVPQAMAAALGLRDDPDRTPLDTLSAGLARRRLLVVLDNCEHLIAACADLAEALLRTCPQLCLLATSREALNCAGETAWRVPSLTLPDPGRSDPDAVVACDATRLFVERVRVAQPGFAVTATSAAAVAQICRRLDGIPLALEMAAARLRGLALDELAARLDERFRLLTGGRRTALSRQQTLQATVEWSYSLLEERERVLFDRLSVFARGFTLDAAEAVCADGIVAEPEVLDLLLRLVDKSLVMAEAGTQGATRYRLLETLQQYGRERLAGRAETTAVRERHADYFLSLAEPALDRFWGPEQRAALDRLEGVRDDLQAAFHWFLESGAPEKSLRLQWPLVVARTLRGATDSRDLVTQLLAAPALQAPSLERALALAWAGARLCGIGDGAGFALLDEALALERRFGDALAVARTLYFVAIHRFDPWGDLEGAQPLLEEALALYRALGDGAWTERSVCLLGLGQVVGALGNHQRAETLAQESLALSQAADDAHGVAYAYEVLGEVAATRGEEAEAERLWTECLVTYRALGAPIAIVTVEGDLGRLAARQGRHAAARAHFTAGLAVLHEPGLSVFGLSELAGLAFVTAVEGQGERALRLAGATTAAYLARGFHLLPTDCEALDRAMALARAGLNEPAAAAAWAEGQVMTLEHAVTYALGNRAQ